MKHETISSQTLRSRHSELLVDVELIATRANAARDTPLEHAGIVAAAEVALVRVLAEWRASRGGHIHNAFFDPISKRLRRIIRVYRKVGGGAPVAEVEGKRWIYQITSYEELPFDRLKPFFRASHVDQAIKMGITMGLREMPGLRIYPDEEIS